MAAWSNIALGAGDDTFLSDGTLQDTLVKGGDGNDTFTIVNHGHKSQYELNGGAGDDIFYVSDGNVREEYRGGVVYAYSRRDGRDTIITTYTTDTIKFDEGISLDDLLVIREGQDLMIGIKEGGKPIGQLKDTIRIKDMFAESDGRHFIEGASFADGSCLSLSGILGLIEGGLAGDLSLYKVDGLEADFTGESNSLTLSYVNGGSFNLGAGDDTLTAGKGYSVDNITADLGGGNDIAELYNVYKSNISMGSGNDTVNIYEGFGDNSVVDAGSGDDTFLIKSYNTRGLLKGGDGNDSFIIRKSPDSSYGNYFYGDGKSGASVKKMEGGKGDDVCDLEDNHIDFIFNKGDGKDVVSQSGSKSSVTFASGITGKDLSFSKLGDDLIISLSKADSITFRNYFGYGDNRSYLEKLFFADGNVLDVYSATAHLRGDYDDTYSYARGRGKYNISDGGGSDKIVFGAGITLEDLVIKEGNYGSLIVALREDGKTFEQLSDKIEISSFTNGSSFETGAIERFQFADGSIVGIQELMGRAGTDENDSLNWKLTKVDADMGDGDDYVNIGNFDNVITAGKGDDTIQCGTGNDTYIFNKGDGKDRIYDGGGDNDRIIFTDVNANEFGIYDGSYNMEISYGNGDKITLDKNTIEEFRFADGSYLTNEDINYIIQQMASFSADNSIYFGSAEELRMNSQFNQIVMNQLRRD